MTEPALVDNVEVTPAELSAASRTIRLASRAAIYRTDADGLPVDAILRQAIIDARTEQVRAQRAQAAHEQAVKDNAALSPLGVPLASASIEGASYTAAQGETTVPARFQVDADTGLCRAAFEILLDAGLLNGPVIAYG